MKIIEQENLKIYYYNNLEELEQVKELKKFKVNLKMCGKDDPCKFSPRNSRKGVINFILLYNSENKEKDLQILNKCLKLARLSEIKEL